MAMHDSTHTRPRVLGPASPRQEALCLLRELDPARPGLVLGLAFRLDGGTGPDALHRALLRLVARNDALRTRFRRQGDGWQRVADGDAGTAERCCRREALPAGLSDDDFDERMGRWCRETLDPERGPLFRATLVTCFDRPAHLVVRVHHTVADLWSVGLLLNELAALYAEEVTGTASAGEPAPQPGAQAAAPQAADAAWRFWSEVYALPCDPLNLPATPPYPGRDDAGDRPLERPNHQVPLDLGAERSAAVARLARECGVSRYTVLFAAMALAMAALTGARRTPLAVSHHGRTAESATEVGYLLTTVTVPVDARAGTVRDLLAGVRRLLKAVQRHSGAGYPELAARAQSEGGPEIPAPDVTLAMFQDFPATPGLGAALLGDRPLRIGPMELTVVRTLPSIGPWGLATLLADDGERLFGRVELDSGRYRPWFADRLAATLPAAVDALTAAPDAPVRELEVVPAADHARFERWSAAPALPAGDGPDTLHDLVLAAAERHPGRPALIAADGSLTYGELSARSVAVAAGLTGAGVPPEAAVGVLLPRRSDLVPALLGILRSGRAYVGLDPAAPVARLAEVIRRARCGAVLTDGELAGTLHEVLALTPGDDRVRPVRVDRLPPAEAVREPRVAPEAPAYLMFTSGSTGRPKGVVIPHRAAVNLIRYGGAAHTPEELAESLAVSGVHFDLSVWELFLPLAHGHRVRLLDNALDLLDPDKLREAAAGTFLSSVPSAVSTLVEHDALPSGLRLVTMGGDVIPAGLVHRIVAGRPRAKVMAMYGPTETTTYMTAGEAGADVAEPVPIGRPFAGTRLRVVDQDLRLVPAGAVGELLIGGPCVSLGYAGQPGLTAERYLPDPDVPGACLYRSGDLVRWRPDGSLEFAGRTDHQIKIRGFRIELGDVEAGLRRVADLREVAVGTVGSGQDRRLAAYLVPRAPIGDVPGWLRELRERLSAELPGYMLPAEFAALPELPKNRNGKPDRDRLARTPTLALGRRAALAPRTDTERRIARLWADLLGEDAVGVTDDLFELGAHSLVLARAGHLLRAEFEVEVPLAELWRRRTVADLARLVAEGTPRTPRSDAGDVPRLDRSRFRASHAEELR